MTDFDVLEFKVKKILERKSITDFKNISLVKIYRL